MTQDQSDKLYAQQRDVIERFSFDDAVVQVFPDMIRRSVPGYDTIVEMTGVLAARYARPQTRLYDLGCSLGASSLAMASLVTQPGVEIVAVDNSAAMIERAGQLLAVHKPRVPVALKQGDVRQLSLQSASVAVMNFTLQFLPLDDRDTLLADIASALCPGGILVLSEKIRFADAETDALQQSLHHAFKRNNGYSDLEISQKRTALENVLVPETLDAHRERLSRAGFSRVDVWFRCFNFISLVAIR